MTDLQLLKALVDRASLVSSYEAIGLLSDALELVRGVPFDAVGYDWAHEHQHHSRACELIETAGLRLVDLALEADDVVTARTAVSRALAALKINEPLYRARMKIEAHTGNTAGVRSVYDELVCLMNDLDPADGGAPSAQTTQLLRSLNTSAAATRCHAVCASNGGGSSRTYANNAESYEEPGRAALASASAFRSNLDTRHHERYRALQLGRTVGGIRPNVVIRWGVVGH